MNKTNTFEIKNLDTKIPSTIRLKQIQSKIKMYDMLLIHFLLYVPNYCRLLQRLICPQQ